MGSMLQDPNNKVQQFMKFNDIKTYYLDIIYFQIILNYAPNIVAEEVTFIVNALHRLLFRMIYISLNWHLCLFEFPSIKK